MAEPGYHIREIAKGVPGQVSKVREELEELEDALEQGIDIMALCEIADLYGAIELLLKTRFPGTSMDDIRKMSYVTHRAFVNGRRK